MGVLLHDALAAESGVGTAIGDHPETGVNIKARAGEDSLVAQNGDGYIGAAASINSGWGIERPTCPALHGFGTGAANDGRIGIGDGDDFGAEGGVGAAIGRLPSK